MFGVVEFTLYFVILLYVMTISESAVRTTAYWVVQDLP